MGPKYLARQLEAKLLDDERLGLDIVGFVDTELRTNGILTEALGPIEDIERIVGKYRIQEIVVFPESVSEEGLVKLVSLGRRLVLDVTLVTDYAGLVFHQAMVSDLSGRPVVKYPREGSGIISSLVESDGLIELAEEVREVEPGTPVDFLPFTEVFA